MSANGGKEQNFEEVEALSEKVNKVEISEPTEPVVRGVTGEVKWFSCYNGYGFITREDNKKDIFVHTSAIVRSSRLSVALNSGEKVEFDVIQGSKGPEAWTVTGLNGEIVRNVRFIVRRPFNRNHYQQRGNYRQSDDGKLQKLEKSEENNNRRKVLQDKGDDLTESDYEKPKNRRLYKNSGNRKSNYRYGKSKRKDVKGSDNAKKNDEREKSVDSTGAKVAIDETKTVVPKETALA